jgi:hypothetical protein
LEEAKENYKKKKKKPVLGRYLVWRVKIASLGFNSGPTYPIGCKKFQRPAPSSDLENIILVTASLNLTQQKKKQMSKNWLV